MKSNKHNNEKDSLASVDTESMNMHDDSQAETISETRRAFIKKYGALAAITPVAMTLTMHSNKALASSCTECGP